ncbi:MAG TPA: hypothetical protein PLL98_00005, partial [Bacillota bacterium]|nr:hypothetical protein [Bacillota bacterium]
GNIINHNIEKPSIENSKHWIDGFQRAADSGIATADAMPNGFMRVKRKAVGLSNIRRVFRPLSEECA